MRRAPLVALLLLLPPLLAGCAADAPPPDVVATFYPLAFLAARIGGDNITVATMVPAGVEPHDWDPNARDLARLGEARLLLAQGLGFEPWLEGIHRALGERAPRLVVTTTEVAHLTGEAHEHEEHEAEEGEVVDPHTWLDPVRFAQQARAVEAALAEAWPEHAPAFRARADALVEELLALDVEIASALRTCQTRVAIVSHGAFGYFGARYDVAFVSVSGLSPEVEPSAAAIADAIEAARRHNATVIFFEELVSPAVAQVIAREVGASTRVLSPVEGLTPEAASRGEDYLLLMRANVASLREALRCA